MIRILIKSIFLCQITCFKRVKLLKEIPKFYNLSLKNWSAFLKTFSPKSHTEILNCNLFANDNIKNHNKPLFFKPLIKRNINIIDDIWNHETKSFNSNEQLIAKYRALNVFELELIKKVQSCIPINFVDILRKKYVKSANIFSRRQLEFLSQNGKKIRPNNLKMRNILSHMIKSNIKQLNVEIKWQERLTPVSPFKWSVIWSNIHKGFYSTRPKI